MGAGLTANLSAAWSDKLRELEDDVPPRPAADVLQTVREETGVAPMDLFESFDEEPLGSASIGQVHRATLRPTTTGGRTREVAVKVQYPDAERSFALDMSTIRTFCAMFAPEQLIMLDELTRSLEGEFDYRREAENLASVRSNLTKGGFLPREVAVPRPELPLCTRRMLVMEMLPGPKLVDGVRDYARGVAAREGVTLAEFEARKRRELDERGVAPRYEGPSARRVAAYATWLRARDAVHNAGGALYNAVFARPLGLRRVGRRQTVPPPNAPRIMDVLMRVHGHQLLIDGCFQADPHGGNFLLLPDGRVGLIDFGATKQLTRGERLSACILYAAIARGDRDAVLRLCRVGGYKSKHMDMDVCYKLCRFGYDTYGRDLLGDKNIQQVSWRARMRRLARAWLGPDSCVCRCARVRLGSRTVHRLPPLDRPARGGRGQFGYGGAAQRAPAVGGAFARPSGRVQRVLGSGRRARSGSRGPAVPHVGRGADAPRARRHQYIHVARVALIDQGALECSIPIL